MHRDAHPTLPARSPGVPGGPEELPATGLEPSVGRERAWDVALLPGWLSWAFPTDAGAMQRGASSADPGVALSKPGVLRQRVP